MSDNATLPATGTVVRAIDKAGTVTQDDEDIEILLLTL